MLGVFRSISDAVPFDPIVDRGGRSTYESLASWMRLSVENQGFLRGVVWLVALMPDRAQAIDALEKVAQTAATYV